MNHHLNLFLFCEEPLSHTHRSIIVHAETGHAVTNPLTQTHVVLHTTVLYVGSGVAGVDPGDVELRRVVLRLAEHLLLRRLVQERPVAPRPPTYARSSSCTRQFGRAQQYRRRRQRFVKVTYQSRLLLGLSPAAPSSSGKPSTRAAGSIFTPRARGDDARDLLLSKLPNGLSYT